jgi:transcriptional regulator with XRE-family HTH domain
MISSSCILHLPFYFLLHREDDTKTALQKNPIKSFYMDAKKGRAEINRAFGLRLAGLMRDRGWISTQNRSGVDVARLAQITGSSYEMARRYVEGRAIPRADKLTRVAEWLGVRQSDLLDHPADDHEEQRLIHTEVLQSCIRAAREAEKLAGMELPADKMARLVALLYEEAVDGRALNEGLLKRLMRII